MPRKKPNERRQARQFGAILMVAAAILAAVFLFWSGKPTRAWIAGGVSLTVLFFTFVAFPAWLVFFRYWMKFANVMGTVMSTVILTIFFFLVFTPISLFMRMIGKTPLDLTWKDGKQTYWKDKTPRPRTLESYEKQF